jgi:hypothetical protein
MDLLRVAEELLADPGLRWGRKVLDERDQAVRLDRKMPIGGLDKKPLGHATDLADVAGLRVRGADVLQDRVREGDVDALVWERQVQRIRDDESGPRWS